MDFNITELDLLRDAVLFRRRTLESWQRDLFIANDKMALLDDFDEEIQENLDAIQDYQSRIDLLEPLLEKLSDALFALVDSPTA